MPPPARSTGVALAADVAAGEDADNDDTTFVVRGECNYASQRKVISQTFNNVLEIVRELYSNSHDAGATHVRVYPRAGGDNSMLVWLDNGSGMDQQPLVEDGRRRGNARTALEACFHIGNSTRVPGHGVGQFCHGQKLVLAQADVLFGMLTRTEQMEEGMCWYVLQDDVFAALEGTRGLALRCGPIEEAALALADAANQSQPPADIHQDYASTVLAAARRLAEFKSGTMQVFVAAKTPLHTRSLLDTHPDSKGSWPKPQRVRKAARDNTVERTVLVGCLRYGTRHGSTLADPHGQFEDLARHMPPSYLDACGGKGILREARLFVHAREVESDDGYEVPYGLPYITYSLPPNVGEPSRSESSMRSRTSLWGRFGPRRVQGNSHIAFVKLAIDSHNYRLQEWEPLGRNNGSRCGISMQRFSGVLISAQGVPVLREKTDINKDAWLFDNLPLAPRSALTPQQRDDYVELLYPPKDHNAVLIIDFVNVGLRTDRNDLTPEAYDALQRDDVFLRALANTLGDFGSDAHCPRERVPHREVLLEVMRLRSRDRKVVNEAKLNDYCDARVQDVLEQRRLSVVACSDAPDAVRAALAVLQEEVAVPVTHNEVQLQHLYSHCGAVVRALSRMLRHERHRFPMLMRLQAWWYRIGMLCCQGIDAQAFLWTPEYDAIARERPRDASVAQMRHVEVKVHFGEDGHFNHPFPACDLIVCIGLAGEYNETIKDSLDNIGILSAPDDSQDALHGVGCYVRNIVHSGQRVQSRHDRGVDLEVPVVFFEPLLRETLREVAVVKLHDPLRERPLKKRPKRQRKK